MQKSFQDSIHIYLHLHLSIWHTSLILDCLATPRRRDSLTTKQQTGLTPSHLIPNSFYLNLIFDTQNLRRNKNV